MSVLGNRNIIKKGAEGKIGFLQASFVRLQIKFIIVSFLLWTADSEDLLGSRQTELINTTVTYSEIESMKSSHTYYI